MLPQTRSAIAVATLVGLSVLAACAPTPTPTLTPTPIFATEEEAFAAAEEVYRAYNDALNARRTDASGLDPQQYLTASALEADIDAQNEIAAAGLKIQGVAIPVSFTGLEFEWSGSASRVVALICVNVSDVSVLDAAGEDVTPAERGDVVGQHVTFVDSERELSISQQVPVDAEQCQ